MKVQIDIPLDLRFNNNGVFTLSKETLDSTDEVIWETIYTATGSSGTYLADLTPGNYLKALSSPDGTLGVSSTFGITEIHTYVDTDGNTFEIAEDGTLQTPEA